MSVASLLSYQGCGDEHLNKRLPSDFLGLEERGGRTILGESGTSTGGGAGGPIVPNAAWMGVGADDWGVTTDSCS